MKKNHFSLTVAAFILAVLLRLHEATIVAYSGTDNEQPLSKIAIHKATLALSDSASVKAKPYVLGLGVGKKFGVHYVIRFIGLFSPV